MTKGKLIRKEKGVALIAYATFGIGFNFLADPPRVPSSFYPYSAFFVIAHYPKKVPVRVRPEPALSGTRPNAPRSLPHGCTTARERRPAPGLLQGWAGPVPGNFPAGPGTRILTGLSLKNSERILGSCCITRKKQPICTIRDGENAF